MEKKSLEDALAELEAKKIHTAEYLAKHAPEIEAETAKRNALSAKLAALSQEERRQVHDSTVLKHISAAPEPISPLKGSSYTPPNKPTEPPQIDWHYWRHMPEVKQWEACALSLNINPDNMKHHPQAWMATPGSGPLFTDASFSSKAVQSDFYKRLRLLGASLFSSRYFTAVNKLVMGSRHLATLSLQEFAAWALHVELERMPPELVQMAETKTAPTLMPEPHATAPSPATVVSEPVEQRRARYLTLFEMEEKREKRGALQRVADSEGVDRSNMSKDINKARDTRDAQKRAGGGWGSQLVQGGKRTD